MIVIKGATRLVFCAAMVLAAVPASARTDADARFEALSAREWAWRVEQHVADIDPRIIDPVLPDVSAPAQAARLAYWQGVRRELDTVDPARLSPATLVDYQVYRAQLDVLIAQQRFRDYEKPLTADESFWGGLAETARQSLTSEADYRNYIAQLQVFPRYFRDNIANMRAGAVRGFTPPRVTLTGREETIVSVATAAPEATVYYAPFKAMPAAFPPALQADLRAQGLAAIRDAVIPAHQQLLAFFRDDYVPHARTALAAEALPDGKAYYQSTIREFTTTDLTPAQIHAIGLREVARIQREMQAVMTEVGFTGDRAAFLAQLRTDPRFYAKTPEELLKDAAFIAKKVDGKIGDFVGHLPRQRFAIVPVPADIAPFYTSGRGGFGKYLVNTYDLPSRALYSLPALTLHESAPGHVFQGPLAMENKALPAYRRNYYISAYGEGWALYCETLGLEMGIYETPYERFGMLSYQNWRAARLVVDTGIHSQGWTRVQAQQYLAANTALSTHEIENEVDRYIAWPGQALSYYLGELAILDARHKAEAALGPRFNIRAFHDAVLELGSVPLPVLSARIDRFIAEGGKGPYPDEE